MEMAAKVKCRTSFVTFCKTKIRKIIGRAVPLAPPLSRHAPVKLLDTCSNKYTNANLGLIVEVIYSRKTNVSCIRTLKRAVITF